MSFFATVCQTDLRKVIKICISEYDVVEVVVEVEVVVVGLASKAALHSWVISGRVVNTSGSWW